MRRQRSTYAASRWCGDSPRLASGLEELDRIAVGILELNLSAAGPAFRLIAELHAGLLQRLDGPFDVADAQNDASPTARLLEAANRASAVSRTPPDR